MRSKRTKALEFSSAARAEMWERDQGCIFCKMGLDPPYMAVYGYQAMHYIGRGRGGLGIAQNGAIGCIGHHSMLDQSEHMGYMRELFKQYLVARYPGWDEKKLMFDRWEVFDGI